MVAEATALPVKGFNSGPLGGDQQIGARIVEGKVDIVIFFSVYRLTGALVVFVLYLPVHLLFDCLFLAATSLSCGRARRFCGEDFFCLLWDFLVLLAITAIVCLAEAILLLALFHPLGSIT